MDEGYEYGASTDVESHKSTSTRTSSKRKDPTSFEMESSRYMGYDAVKRIRFHYAVNKVRVTKLIDKLLFQH